MTWDCEAYGPDGAAVGALCFFAGERGERICPDADACRLILRVERERVFAVIQMRAALGEPDFVYLAGVFTDPEQLLGGSRAGEVEDRLSGDGAAMEPGTG